MTFKAINDAQDTVFALGDSEMTQEAPVLPYDAPPDHRWHG